jgi:hypothetical protein
MVLWFVEKPEVPDVGDAEGTDVDGGIVVPIVGALEPAIPKREDETVGDGTVIRELTPAVPISTDPKGIPVREALPRDVDGADPLGDAVPAQGAVPAPIIPPPTDSPPPS